MTVNKEIEKALEQADIKAKLSCRLSIKPEVQAIVENKDYLEWDDFVQMANIPSRYAEKRYVKYSLALLIECLENGLYKGKYIEKLNKDLKNLNECLNSYIWSHKRIFTRDYDEVQFVKTSRKKQQINVYLIKNGDEVFMEIVKKYLTTKTNLHLYKILNTFVISIGDTKLSSYKDINDTVFWMQIQYYKDKYQDDEVKKDIAIKNVCHFYRWLIKEYPEYNFFENSITLTNELIQNNALVMNINKNAYFTTYGIDEDLEDKPLICFILKNYNIHSTRVAKIAHTTFDTSKIEESYYRILANKYIQNLKSVSALTTTGYTHSACSCLHFIEQIKKQDYYPNPDLKYLNTQEAILIRNFVANNSEISLSSLNNNIGSIRRFLQWCKANGYIKFDEIFFDYLAQFEEPNDYHGKSIPDDDLKKISNEFIKLCKEDESYLVYYAIFIILLETEFRVSQVCALTTSALQPSLKNDQFYLYSNTKTSNGKKIQQPICASTKSILSKVMELTESLRNNAVQESSKNLIFLYTKSNGAITPITVEHFRIEFHKVCSKAGVADYNSKHLRDTHMTKAFEFILKTGKSDLEMGLLSKHSVIDTTKLHYIEIELTKMLESIYQVTLGNRDVAQNNHILEELPTELSDKDTEVECGCGHCSAATCNVTGNMSCLMCKHFVTTPSHKQYFIKMIDNCDKLLSQTQIPHEKEDIILIKTLFTNWLREIYIVEEQNNDRKSIN